MGSNPLALRPRLSAILVWNTWWKIICPIIINHQSSIMVYHGISWYIMVYHLPDISSVMFIHISIPVNIWTSLNYFANHSPNLGPYPPILARVRCCDSFPGTWHEAARRDLATGLWVETPEKQRLLRVQIAKGWIRKMEKMDINGPITC